MNHRAPYAIRHYFSEQARRTAARALYVDGRDVYGYCPLGIALMADNRIAAPVTPSAEQVTNLMGRGDNTRTWAAAHRFIRTWDLGLITDLYAALSVERREA